MAKKRVQRLNSLLKEVISEVVTQDVRDPRMAQFVTITEVDITSDLHHAKVFISVIGTPEQKAQTLEALQSAAGFIAVHASKKVVMRFFPSLSFKLDDSVEKHIRIETLLGKIKQEQSARAPENDEPKSP
ncbi:MAG: 30S ribosome-binding factor RbfA [Chlamydiia bacterium]|jgi:ribosome-binding factor A|nr:30S ribosome-binding factor RbfA [Chlamydiia bacterium]